MNDIRQLAYRRYETAAALDALAEYPTVDDPDLKRALIAALIDARKAYAEAERAYQSAISTFSDEEVRAILEGVMAA